jgi:hypothetical protein
MCWKCDSIAPRCRAFRDPYWGGRSEPKEIVLSETFARIAAELVWGRQEAAEVGSPERPAEPERQPAASRLVVVKPGRTALSQKNRAELLLSHVPLGRI